MILLTGTVPSNLAAGEPTFAFLAVAGFEDDGRAIIRGYTPVYLQSREQYIWQKKLAFDAPDDLPQPVDPFAADPREHYALQALLDTNEIVDAVAVG